MLEDTVTDLPIADLTILSSAKNSELSVKDLLIPKDVMGNAMNFIQMPAGAQYRTGPAPGKNVVSSI